jgi:hypothetical protein
MLSPGGRLHGRGVFSPAGNKLIKAETIAQTVVRAPAILKLAKTHPATVVVFKNGKIPKS